LESVEEVWGKLKENSAEEILLIKLTYPAESSKGGL
jgi:hypothetical protein